MTRQAENFMTVLRSLFKVSCVNIKRYIYKGLCFLKCIMCPRHVKYDQDWETQNTASKQRQDGTEKYPQIFLDVDLKTVADGI